ncbi:MAG: hypothetical protein JNN03_18910, partial [Rubrivivax sp.]|nr:hypothetical protein [Rubrivivax sp.]
MAEQGFFSAPYNFVPLADWVLRPPWSHLVSQDVPLSEGLCAEIGIRVTNDTPLLVGGPQSREPGRAREVTFFRHPDGTPALPGSSLRGMVRAVLEVLSFSRVQVFDDRQLAIRDVRPGAPYMDRMVSRKGGLARPLAHTGWLRFDRGLDGWVVQPCEHLRVAHELLAQEQPDGLGVDIQGLWERKNEDCRTVGWKYGLFNPACAAGFAVDVKAAAAPVRRRRGDVHIERREVEAIRAAAADGPASGCVRGRLVLT